METFVVLDIVPETDVVAIRRPSGLDFGRWDFLYALFDEAHSGTHFRFRLGFGGVSWTEHPLDLVHLACDFGETVVGLSAGHETCLWTVEVHDGYFCFHRDGFFVTISSKVARPGEQPVVRELVPFSELSQMLALLCRQIATWSARVRATGWGTIQGEVAREFEDYAVVLETMR